MSSVGRTFKGASTRDIILDAALKLASKAGLEGITIGTLAKEVGMSKSGLFAHFNSKDNLQLMVLERAAELFTAKVLKPAFEKPRGESRVRAIFENWLAYLNDGSALPGGSVFVAAAFELDDRPGVLRDYVQKAQKDLIRNLRKAAEMAIKEGHFSKKCDPGQFAWTMYSFVLGYHHSKRMLNDPHAEKNIRQAFERLVDLAKSEEVLTYKERRRA